MAKGCPGGIYVSRRWRKRHESAKRLKRRPRSRYVITILEVTHADQGRWSQCRLSRAPGRER